MELAALTGLVGVIVGAVLSAGFGAWRDYQQRAHQQRAEIRTERLAAVAAFLAADDRFWRSRTALRGMLDRSESELERSKVDRVLQEDDGAVLEVDQALSRVRLLSPDLGRLAVTVRDNTFDDAHDTSRVTDRREKALQEFEHAARGSLGIKD